MITEGVLARLSYLFNEHHEDIQVHMDNTKLIIWFRVQDEKFEHISLVYYAASRYLSTSLTFSPYIAICPPFQSNSLNK